MQPFNRGCFIMKEIARIVIKDYVDKVKFSNSRRAKYFIKGITKMANKYITGLNTGKYIWITKNGKKYLADSTNKELIIANPKAVGTPNIKPIKGNDFYAGFAAPHQRMTVIETIKENFNKEFSNINEIKKYPLHIEFHYYDVMDTKTSKSTKQLKVQDLDNKRFAYEKSGLDLLKTLGKIPDDNVHYVRKLSSEFFPVKKEDRRLEIIFYEYKNSVNRR